MIFITGYSSPTEWTVNYYRRSFFSSISRRGNRSTEISLDPSCFREQTLGLFVRLNHIWGIDSVASARRKRYLANPQVASQKSRRLLQELPVLAWEEKQSIHATAEKSSTISIRRPEIRGLQRWQKEFQSYSARSVNILSFTRFRAYSSMSRYFLLDDRGNWIIDLMLDPGYSDWYRRDTSLNGLL